MRNIVKVLRLIFQILFITYFVGQYWFIFVDIVSLAYEDEKIHHEQEVHGVRLLQKIIEKLKGDDDDYYVEDTFFVNSNWNIIDLSGGEKTIVSMYYALTSLSTTGFGDLYPKNDFERLVCSFMLLGGVTIFSYVLSELR